MDKICEVAKMIGDTQSRFGLQVTSDDILKNLKFGLVDVVYGINNEYVGLL